MERAAAYAPGSTSNLGPGFDCLGIAFTGKGDLVRVERRGPAGVRVLRVSDPEIPTEPERNTAAIAAAAVARRLAAAGNPGAPGPSPGLELSIDKGLPLAGGLGGSAASAVAGALATHAVLEGGLSPTELLESALEAEAAVAGRHLDNIAPALLGGAVLVTGIDPPRFCRVRVDASLRLVLVTPGYRVATAHARSVLPRDVPRADAVAQAAHLGALLLGLERGDAELLRHALVDRIAEPARRALYPGYPEARAAAEAMGALGVVVSGAGPTLVAIAPKGAAEPVASALEDAYRALGLTAAAHVAGVDLIGARLVA